MKNGMMEEEKEMKIAIGCDPNAQDAKMELIQFMESKGYGEITDFGSEDPIYANTATKVAEEVASGAYDRGILICGTGLTIGNKSQEELVDAFLTNEFVPGCASQPKVDAFVEYEREHMK